MAFIDITTNNLSRELTNSPTFIDNWAYVPGTTKTGNWKVVYPFTSLQDFQDTCGIGSPEGSITYEYVSGLLSAGIPVLFRRIACTGQDTPAETLGVTQAQVILTNYDSDTSSEQNDVKILEKYGGTYGNNLSVTVRNTGTAYWLEVYYNQDLVEKNKLITIAKNESQLDINTALIEALTTMEFQRITVEVLVTDPSKFVLEPVTMAKLSGGTDFDESLVPAEIPRSYQFIKDKILYQPKFLTSGGYTDSTIISSDTTSIAQAMMNLSLIRQDCRALIDIPIGTPAEDQQEIAAQLGYQQVTNTQSIPSASICAPWQYMQVGNSQVWMPPSYAYLVVVGNALSNGNPVYTPKAGISTGRVPNIIRSEFDIGSDLAEQWQSDTEVNINPIMRLQGGYYVIAGNSTLLIPEENNAFAESSADLTIIEIRRYVYNTGLQLQYQYNSVDAFEKFALNVSKFLNTMQSNGAIMDYSIANVTTSDDPRVLKIQLDVYVSPTIKKIQISLNVSYGNIEMSVGGVA